MRDGLEVAFFAAPDEPFRVALELVPLLADLLGLVRSDGVVPRRLRNAVEKLRKLVDDLARGWQDVTRFPVGILRIADKVAAASVREPLDYPQIFGEMDDFQESVERAVGAAAALGLFLRPLVNKVQRDPQFRGDRLRTGLLEGVFQGLVGFHGGDLSGLCREVLMLLGICFFGEAPETASGPDRRAGNRGVHNLIVFLSHMRSGGAIVIFMKYLLLLISS